MISLHCPRGYELIGCASDRKDFYHQAKITREKAFCNLIPFSFRVSEFHDSSALSELFDEVTKPTRRETHGGRLGLERRKPMKKEDISELYGGFKSLFPGDHLGVEFALESHSGALQKRGLLCADETILQHRPFPLGPVWQCLVIDDFCAISCEKNGSRNIPLAVERLNTAERVYAEEKILGFDEKTVRGASTFIVIGAEIQSSDYVRNLSLITVGSPLAKRIALASLSLRTAELPFISRALGSRLAGAWTSSLMFCRSLCSVLDGIFSFDSRSAGDADEVLEMPRSVAQELVLACIVSLLAISDVSVPYDEHIYATDVFMSRGAITRKRVPADVSSVLWVGGDKKGCYTMLDSPTRTRLRSLGDDTDHLPAEHRSCP